MISTLINLKGPNEIKAMDKTKALEGIVLTIIGFSDFLKDMIYIVMYPHISPLITLLLWMSIFGPVGKVFTDQKLGDYNIRKTMIIYFGLEWVPIQCCQLEHFCQLEKLIVLSWVTMSENFV